MAYPPHKFLFFLPLLIWLSAANAQSPDRSVAYGLEFASHEVSKDHRTGLDLNPEQPFKFDKDFEIRFDLAFRRLKNAYGYILRIIANDSLNIDLLSSPSHKEFYDLNVIINNTPSDIHYDFAEIDLKATTWTEMAIKFSRKDSKLYVSWNGQTKNHHFPVSTLRTFRLYFGANDFGRFSTKDVPPISIRDIEILKSNTIIQKWPLKNHRITNVYDSANQRKASVKNAVWSIDKHTKWVHREQLLVDKYPSAAFNSRSGQLYLSTKNRLITFDVANGKTTRNENLDGSAVYTDANQLIYIEENHALVNYDLRKNIFSEFDFNKQKWRNSDTTYIEPDYWHHNKFYNPVDSSLYVFGGYGHFSYKNAFFKYNTTTAQWVPVTVNGSIPPRYLSASGITRDRSKALIFGGYGSISGKQELFPQSYHDLHSVDLRTLTVTKEWEFPETNTSQNDVFANSMIINENDNCFYALGFPKNKYESHIRLRRYGLNRPEVSLLADSIPFRFHDEDAFSDLFLSERTGELIAVTAHEENDQFKINVYSINYPPLSQGDVLQTVDSKANNATLQPILLSFGICGTLVLLLLVWRKYKKTTSIDTIEDLANQNDRSPSESSELDTTSQKQVSTINLFGGFQVFDRLGNDITGQFTMTLKELFVLILLHSIKFEKGISTLELEEHLWPDKDESSARNNRNVNIKKLRSLLSEIGNIALTNNNSYLHLSIGSDVHCDFQSVSRLLNNASPTRSITPGDLRAILVQINRGSLLPNLQAHWLDDFKSDISNKVIDALLEFSTKLDAVKDDKMLIDIADSIFKYDSINQEALVIKCSVLNSKGKYSLAKIWYEHFTKEYKSLYAEQYPKTFEEIISKSE